MSEINKVAVYNKTFSVRIGSFKNVDKVPISDGSLDAAKLVKLPTLSEKALALRDTSALQKIAGQTPLKR